MLSNARGAAILANTVTTATFRGPPMIACSTNYTDTFPATAWANLLTLATILDAPAIHIDFAHDGAGAAAALRTSLLNIQKFYTPGITGPWQHDPPLSTFPPLGPLFFFQRTVLITGAPDFQAVNTGAYFARQLAETCTNFRRNHLYYMGLEGVWLTSESLDLVQRPPVYTFRDEYTDPTFWTSDLLGSWWRSGRPPQGNEVITLQQQYAAGLDRLATLEGTYPGISRHFHPPLVFPDASVRLFVLAHN